MDRYLGGRGILIYTSRKVFEMILQKIFLSMENSMVVEGLYQRYCEAHLAIEKHLVDAKAFTRPMTLKIASYSLQDESVFLTASKPHNQGNVEKAKMNRLLSMKIF